MRVQTPINGITSTSLYEEGDCYSLVNLRKKNGTLHPVSPRGTEFKLQDNYNIIFFHQFNDYENWIGTKNAEQGGSIVYWNINNEPEAIFDTGLGDRIISIQQIGNTLSLITEKRILYLLFNNNAYNALGELPDMEPISWFQFGNYAKDIIHSYTVDKDYPKIVPEELLGVLKGQFNVLRKKLYADMDGCLYDSHLMVFAFRLFDGSTIKHSSPVLLCNPLFEACAFNLFFIFQEPVDIYHVRCNMLLNAYKIFLEYDLSYLSKWSDIIKSVDVFLSPGLSSCSESNMMESTDDLLANVTITHERNLVFNLMKDDAKMIENIKSVGNLYLIASLKAGTKSSYDPASMDTTNVDSFPNSLFLGDIDNLIYKENLELDTFSHHKITGNVSTVYNNRLHIAGIKTILFQGFGINHFFLPNIFLGKYAKFNNALTLSGIDYVIDEFDDVQFNGSPIVQSPDLYFEKGIMIAVYLKTIVGETIVYSKYEKPVQFWVNPLFSYPDPRAFKVLIYEIKSENQFRLIHQSDLIQSLSRNYSYFLSTFIQLNGSGPSISYVFPFKANENNSNTVIETIEIPNVMQVYSEENKLKVSELNNPFIFPNSTTYLVSNGKILNMASVAIRIAEGQFGQYPLYVFTNKGIYSMNIGNGDTVYASEAAPTSYEVPSTPVICPTPFGVVFTSERGVCIISGQNVELLTYAIQQQPKELNIQSTPTINDMLLNFGSYSFVEYTKEIEYIIYNSHENELIIIDKESPFNWVLNFDSKQFYQSTEIVDQIVENTFPELKVIEAEKVKNYAKAQENRASVSLITRPLLFGSTDLKKLERMFFRATLFVSSELLFDPSESIILNYYSIDEENFFALRGMKIKPENRKDFDMGLFARSKYRQFIFAFAGTISEKSEIKYLETEIKKEYENTKMR
jgi:hypothetical protein